MPASLRAGTPQITALALSAVACLVLGTAPPPGSSAGPAPTIALYYPLDGTLYPANLTPPTWSWEAAGEGPWRIEVSALDGATVAAQATVHEPRFVPDAPSWSVWRALLGDGRGQVRVVDLSSGLASASASFAFAEPAVGTLVFRWVTAPFHADPLLRTRLRRQSVSELESTPLVPDLPLAPCRGCHAIHPDGDSLAVQVRDPYEPHTEWLHPHAHGSTRALDLPAPPFGRTSGLAWTPDGALVVAMDLELDYSVEPDGLELTVHASDLARVDPTSGAWQLVAGASDPTAVEDFPDVSPDGATLAFVRGPRIDVVEGDLDIWTVPLRGEHAGRARPLEGASGGGIAHYFPRHSPDGRWIAFVRSNGGYFARPEADLYLVPATGGEARRLAVNTAGRMDSWPSWSLDGRWLAWASRRDDPDRTHVYLTRIDDNGRASPPVRLPGEAPPPLSYNHPTFSRSPDRAEFPTPPRDPLLTQPPK